MSRSRTARKLLTRNVPVSLSRSRSKRRRLDEVPIHRHLGDSPAPATMDDRSADPIIRYANLGGPEPEFDEFIAHNAIVHIEAMGATSWWIGITLPDGRNWHINLGAHNDRARFFAHCEEV